MKRLFLPSKRLLGLVCVWLLVAMFAAMPSAPWMNLALTIWQGLGVALAAALAADFLMAWQSGTAVQVQRIVPAAWPVGVEKQVTLRLTRQGESAHFAFVMTGTLYDHLPGNFRATDLPLKFRLRVGQYAEVRYRAIARVRGDHQFDATDVRLNSPLGLWQTQYRSGHAETVRVFPDFAKVAQYALLATDNRLSQIGVLHKRRRGEGMEFHQLREYREGDTPRQIDWKSTARHSKLISRDYQDERNQQIVFLLDCGQRMRTKELEPLAQVDGESNDPPQQGLAHYTVPLSHFDHTLNAMLLLSYVALRQGDGVGLATFSHPTLRTLKPRKSATTLKHMMNAVYDLEPSLMTSDYLAASRALSTQLTKRSCVVVLTNLSDDDSDTLTPALALLRRRHLVVVASLKEPVLRMLQQKEVSNLDDALTYAAALEYIEARQRQISLLRHNQVRCIDVEPAQLPIALVTLYWQLKHSGAL